MLCVESIWRIIDDRSQVVMDTGHSFLAPARFERCVPSDTKIKLHSVSPTLSFALPSISTLLSSSISAFLCLPPPVRSVHFNIEEFRWHIAVDATRTEVNEMLGVGWRPHQPSHASDDVWNTVFYSVLVIVIPSHILESV